MKTIRIFIIMAVVALGIASDAAANPIVYGNNRLTLITPTLFRLEYAHDGRFEDRPSMFAWDRDAKLAESEYQVKEVDGKLEITTSALVMTWERDGYPFGLHNFSVMYTLDGKPKRFTNRDIKRNNLGGAVSTLDRVAEEIPLDNGLLSRDGWYIINDTGKDLVTDDGLVLRDKSHVQDQYCFVYGNDYKAALADLGAISGHVPMTRKYVHGVWYCRYWDYTTQDYLDILEGYSQNDFPLDNMVFDMGWHTQKEAVVGTGHSRNRGWTGYTWNRKLIPDPAYLIKRFHDENITVSLNDHPHDGIRPHEEMFEAFMTDMGEDPKAKKGLIFDASDANYMEKFFKHAHGGSEEMGVDFWWLDWQQDYLYPLVRGTTSTHLTWINKLYFDKSERTGKRGAGYSRWAGWGDHRYPIQFSGDAHANWEMLAFEIKLTSTSGNSGCYYWAHDIGGFYGGTDPELYARWSQFGAVSAALRIHSVKDPKLDRRPWLWGDMATESIRRAYHLRSKLMPYVYTSVRTTHETMVPLNRAMYIDYTKEEQAYDNPQQFMFGDLLLAAPITAAGQGDMKVASQKVWFPAGERWYDLFDGTRYEGGTEQNVSKDINEFPLFVKGGWLLPMQPYRDRPATAPLDTLVLRVYPGADGSDNTFRLYEDDGISNDYKEGIYSTTMLTCRQQGDLMTIEISAAEGTYNGQPLKRAVVIEVGGVGSVSEVKDGRRSVRGISERDGLKVIELPSRSKDQPITLTMKIQEN